jgi:hypothetical protein
MVGGHPFQTTDGDRCLFNPLAAAGRFTRAVTDSSENAGKDVGLPVDGKGLVIFAVADQADILRNRRMGRTGKLAVNNFMEILGVGNVCRFQKLLLRQ